MTRLAWLQQAIPAVAQRVLYRREQTTASFFKRDLDPHLVTAVAMVRRADSLRFDGTDVEWLASMTEAESHPALPRGDNDPGAPKTSWAPGMQVDSNLGET
jgi:hypothetical protein